MTASPPGGIFKPRGSFGLSKIPPQAPLDTPFAHVDRFNGFDAEKRACNVQTASPAGDR